MPPQPGGKMPSVQTMIKTCKMHVAVFNVTVCGSNYKSRFCFSHSLQLKKGHLLDIQYATVRSSCQQLNTEYDEESAAFYSEVMGGLQVCFIMSMAVMYISFSY
jgi:hypothetical protein